MKKRLPLLLVLIMVFLASSFTGFIPKAAAATNYNDIIDDAIFDNYSSMTASQIDSFLNTFPSSCISTNNGFTAPDPTGYTPSTGYTYGSNVSAGTVIYHAAQAYGINPQVILATLEKEQGLVLGDGGNVIRNGTDCGALAISASMGYNCPDSQVLTSYSGFTLYAHNGVPVTSVSNTCVRSSAYVGFSRQVIIAAWQLTFDRHRSEGLNNWYVNKPNWDNSDDLNFCYSQRTVAGGPFYLCPDQDGHANDPDVVHSGQYPIDNITVTIANGATAALYNYTPHTHGQDLFTVAFNNWFGSTHVSPAGIRPASQSAYATASCNVPIYTSLYVGRLYQPDTQDFLYTTSQTEACSAVKDGYIWDGVVMQSVSSTDPNAEPVYRLANLQNHLFTTSATVKNTYLTQYGYHDEGIGWYVYGTNVANSLPVTELTNNISTFMFTDAAAEANYYQTTYGYSSFGTAFYTPNMGTTVGATPIYRLSRDNQRLYTTDPLEKSIAIQNDGYIDEGVLANGDNEPNQNNLPVYRLRSPQGSYLYTTDRKERDLAVINYGFYSEGIGFYDLLYSSTPIYRDTNYSQNLMLYTNSALENTSAVQKYGFTGQGISWYGY
jgi:hypothetical protein